MDRIEIDNLRLCCHIGFRPHELHARQEVLLSLRIGMDLRAAGASDDPADASDYRALTKTIIRHVATRRWQLVEALATEIARICLCDFGAAQVQVRVHKPGALRFADSVGVCIERHADDFDDS